MSEPHSPREEERSTSTPSSVKSASDVSAVAPPLSTTATSPLSPEDRSNCSRTVSSKSSTEWGELIRRYRLLQDEVLWPYFELTERVRATQMKAMTIADIIDEGIRPHVLDFSLE